MKVAGCSGVSEPPTEGRGPFRWPQDLKASSSGYEDQCPDPFCLAVYEAGRERVIRQLYGVASYLPNVSENKYGCGLDGVVMLGAGKIAFASVNIVGGGGVVKTS